MATVEADTPVLECAQLMRDRDIGSVGVRREGKVRGIVTDRDIVLRAVAEDRDPHQMRAGDICGEDLAAIEPNASLEQAEELMAERRVRRLLVVDGQRPVGVLTAEDVARARGLQPAEPLPIDEAHLLRGDQGHTGQAE